MKKIHFKETLFKSNSRGQSLQEYLLVASVLGVGSIVGLVTFTDTFSAAGPGLVSMIFHNNNNMPTSSAPSPPVTPSGPVGPGIVEDDLDYTSPLTYTLANGDIVTLPNYLTNLRDSIETAGANGTTEILLANFESLISQLEASGEIDAAQAHSLAALANQGHRIAAIEATFENAASLNGSLTFDGNSYNTLTLANRLAINWSGGYQPNIYIREAAMNDLLSDPNATYNPGTMGPEMKSFLDLFHAAKSNGSMSNPATAAIVQELALNIGVLADHTATILWTGINPTPESLRQAMISDSTHLSSQGICAAGNHEDTGISCSG